jgi:hypothetical protein
MFLDTDTFCALHKTDKLSTCCSASEIGEVFCGGCHDHCDFECEQCEMDKEEARKEAEWYAAT